MVDLIAYREVGNTVMLNRSQRRSLAMVLHHACGVNNSKVSVATGIDMMINSIKNSVLADEERIKLQLPMILPIEEVCSITE